jgi:uncharacterized repeat protein (TIGR01451 family)
MRRLSVLLVATILPVALGGSPAQAQGGADLRLSLSASQPSVIADQPVTFTIHVTNAGPDPADRTHVFDRIPADVLLSAWSEGGTYQPDKGRVAWKEGTVAPSQTVTESVTVTPIHPQDPLTDEARTRTSSDDPTTPNTEAADTQVEPEPGVEYVSVSDSGLTPSFHNVPLGSTVQWDCFGPSVHEITDAHGLGLFDTGSMTPISYARFTFDLSGEFRTQDLPEFPANAGKLVVPVQASPSSGALDTSYTVTWALSAPPAGLVEDVQIKPPGGVWTRWHSDQSTILQDAFVADAGAGTYAFRSRLRSIDTDARSRFGPPVKIDVAAS